jgi:PAS domain S-box-containing protein
MSGMRGFPLDGESLADLARLRFTAIVESSDDAIVSKNLDGVIQSWNPAAERIFGYTADEMIGQPIFTLIPDDLHDEEHALLARIRQGEHVAHYETSRIRKDGRRIAVSLTLSPVRGPSGELIGASAIKRDITSQRVLEQQLQQAQRMEAIGRLAGGVAHDFNNLLTVIGGMTALLLRRHPEGSRDHNDLEQVAHAADRAAALTQQLLTFGRRQPAGSEPLEPNHVIRAIEPMLRRLIGEHIDLRIRLAADLGQVRINQAQLEQVVMNLAANARDAMPDGGTLTIETENVDMSGGFAQEQLRLTPGVYSMLAVTDSGIGMDAITQANIFEPFFTTKGAGKGTGLGLATVYGIVQQAGGAIYVYSEPRTGSAFKVYLPCIASIAAAGAVEPPVTPPAAPAHTPRATVLLAEDEPNVRAFTGFVLEEAGYHVLEAESGSAGLAKALDYPGSIELLLTDVVMPGMNGRLLAESLHKTRPEMAVLYMSGYTDDMVVRTGVVAAGAAFLQKPFTPAKLLDHVRAVLAQRAQVGERSEPAAR